jgi:transposase
MKILAIDLGKNKSVFVDCVTGAAEPSYGKIGTNACEMQKLLEHCAPDRLVIEAGPASGWVHDLAEKLGIPVQVANGNDERWHWKAVKHKTDRTDALKLAQLSEMNSLPAVHVPSAKVRQWRALIEYRHALVQRRTAIKNSIRAIYERQGLALPSAKAAWTQAAVEELTREAEEGAASALWLLQVQCELQQLQTVQTQIQQLETKLAELGKANPAVQRLQTAPYVGPRLSEAVVAILDDPHRFGNSRQVGCYAGLTPRQWQSGQSDRQGHISKAGNKLLRKLLTEIAWLGVRNKTWMLQVYENVRRGSDKRKKIAIVAVARRLLVKLWAMLRDGTEWTKDKIPVNQAASVAAIGAT